MSPEEQVDEILKYKASGNAFHKEKNYRKAVGQYHRAIMYVKALENPDIVGAFPGLKIPKKPKKEISEETRAKLTEAKVAIYNNLSACLMLVENPNYQRVLEHLSVVLEANPDNVKANYRRGQALAKVGDHDDALEAFRKVKALQGGKCEEYLKAAIAASEKHVEASEKRNKQMYQKMFA